MKLLGNLVDSAWVSHHVAFSTVWAYVPQINVAYWHVHLQYCSRLINIKSAKTIKDILNDVTIKKYCRFLKS